MGSSPEVSLTFYVRASAPSKIINRHIETLQEYQEKTLIDEFGVEIWPDKICVTEYTADSHILASYDRLRTWADDHNVSLEPAFARQERTALVDDDIDTVIDLPVMCLALSIDEALVSVAPHKNGTIYTVSDVLADFESLLRGESIEGAPGLPQSSHIMAESA